MRLQEVQRPQQQGERRAALKVHWVPTSGSKAIQQKFRPLQVLRAQAPIRTVPQNYPLRVRHH